MEGYRRATSLVLCCLLYAAAAYAAQPQYTFTDLGAFRPNGIAGPWVVGQENGQPTRLNLDTGQKIMLGHQGFGGVANAVLATGQAVGVVYRSVSVFNTQATFWDATGQAFPLPGPVPSVATAINQAQTVSGSSSACPAGQQAIRWYPLQGQYECLTGVGGSGIAISGEDRVWGHIDASLGASLGARNVAVWEVGQPPYVITTEGGRTDSAVSAANETIAVGSQARSESPAAIYAVRFSLPATVTRLASPPLSLDFACQASGVNAANVIVGNCQIHNPSSAMLWTDTTTRIDLNTLTQAPFQMVSATGINDDGEIIGRLNNGNGYLLTPVPVHVASAPCGGQVVCRCGDTVTSDYVFQANLRCDPHGTAAALIIGDHVSVSGNNFYLIGTGDGIGVLFDRTQSSQLGALHVAGFDTGVLMRGSRGSVYHSSWVWDHRHDGVRLEAGAQDNWIWGVYSLLNGLRSGNSGSGIALDHADRNIVIYSIAWANPTALSLTNANGNWSWDSTWYGGQHPVTMVNSHYNGLYQSVFIEGTITLQQSDDNSWFPGNDIRVPIVRQDAVASR